MGSISEGKKVGGRVRERERERERREGNGSVLLCYAVAK